MAWTNTTPTEGILESDDEYWQAYGMHTYEQSNGISTWTNYEWATFRVREKVTRYSGVTLAQSESLMSGSVLEVTGLMANGSEVFEYHSVKVGRRRANPCGGYDVVKTEKWTALYVNGSYARGAALSCFAS